MPRFFLVVIGFILGWQFFEWPLALILAAIAYAIGYLIERPNAAAPNWQQQFQQLQDRIQKLEFEVQQLRTQTEQTTVAEITAIPAPAPPPAQTIATVSGDNTSESTQSLALPGLFSKITLQLQAWLFGGNTVVRLGIIILFFGVGFLLKYASDNHLLPIEYRLCGLVLGAGVLLGIGWRLRLNNTAYALILQGGAIGIWYMTAFAALKLYQLLPEFITLSLLVIIGVISAYLALKQNARSLAVMGICGGFLAPILVANGTGNHVMLFSYYAILNASIFAMAWFKAWRSLNLIGFFFTFAIATLWGTLTYRSAFFNSTEPFLILFFLFYVAITVLYARHQPSPDPSSTDATLLFGTPIVCFALQGCLLQNTSYGLAYSAVALALFYWVLAYALRRHSGLKRIGESFTALGVIFASLAVPLAFDAHLSSAIWAIEGAGVVWISVLQQRRLPLAFGLLLQMLASIGFLIDGHYFGATPILNAGFIGGNIIAISSLFSAWCLQRSAHTPWPQAQNKLRIVGWLFVLGGWLWWLGTYAAEIDRFVSWQQQNQAMLLFALISSLIFNWIYWRGYWHTARWPAQVLPIGLVLISMTQMGYFLSHLVWPVALLVNYWLLHRYDKDRSMPRFTASLHLISLWLIMGIFVHDFNLIVNSHIPNGTWSISAWALLATLALLLLIKLGHRWPIHDFKLIYWLIGALPITGFLWLWGFDSALASGDTQTGFYLPLLNPIDLMQCVALASLALWLRQLKATWPDYPWPNRAIFAAAGMSIFVWLNAVLLRTLHHSQHIAYQFDALMHSMQVQMSLTIFWTVLALSLMLLATRQLRRDVWLVGASLLTVVVVKLFVFDLSQISGIERIVAFIAVGILLLFMGYFSPLPPRQERSGGQKSP
ncbi:DUF2339 domain-containing protein [uncultured Deefgea sp.]|uniref:DUF2339 domain-containing protein n=1 Tax=uncultured Deefgea sp. TaxID=1304914 RepID=UPI002597A757|nr:DUF2339 domain-containing protein [uncultured Deefgea sp.]